MVSKIQRQFVGQLVEVVNDSFVLSVVPQTANDWLQQLHLSLRFLDGFVGRVEFLKPANHRINGLVDVGFVEHLRPYEVGQVRDLLHRNGLVEQVQCFFVANAEHGPEARGVFLE